MLIDENELFIFDWDGTLVTSSTLVRVSKLLKARYKMEHIMKHKEEYRVRSVRDLAIKEDANKAFSIIYRFYSRLTRVKLKPGSEELLKLLKKRGKKVCIFSDSNATRLLSEARQTGITGHIDFLLSADAIERYKPDPSGILLMADKYRISKSKTVYIGDMASDVFASRFAGVNACVVADGLDPLPIIRQAKPDYLFASTEALLRHVSRSSLGKKARRR